MSFFLENEIDDTIIRDFESFLDDKQINQQNILKLLTKLIFYITKIISQIPSILDKHMSNYNKTIQKIDTELNFLKNSDFCLAESIQQISSNNSNSIFYNAIEYGSLPIIQHFIEKNDYNVETKDKEEKTRLHYACEKGHLP